MSSDYYIIIQQKRFEKSFVTYQFYKVFIFLFFIYYYYYYFFFFFNPPVPYFLNLLVPYHMYF